MVTTSDLKLNMRWNWKKCQPWRYDK